MPNIKADVLKICRERKHLSQEELGNRARIDKGTISRIERGDSGAVRPRTIESLAKCLEVVPDVLTGQAPLPAAVADQPADSRSQLNIRIRDSARNALTLVANRYRTTPTEIIELAPFLFECAASKSLQRRREGVEKLEKLFAEASQVQRTANDHLNYIVSAHHESEEILRAEKTSIKSNDIRGHELNAWDEFGPQVIDPDAEEDPFVSYLKALGRETGEQAEFESWYSFPLYTVCWSEMLALANGDTAMAEHIQDGMIALHEMPKDVRGDKEARLTWLSERKVEADKKAAEAFAELRDLLGYLEKPKEDGK